MLARLRPTLLPLAAALALAAGTVLSAGRIIDGMRGTSAYEVTWVPRGEALRAFSPSLRLSFANYYWLSTVQYIGDRQAQALHFPKLFPLVDLVTDLDPGHGYAYQSAGIVLSSEGRLDESDRLLKKGMEKGPNWWSFPFYIAFNHYFYRGDYAEGARWAEIAARTPGASPNISHLALSLNVKSGATDHAVEFLSELRKVAKDETTAAALEEQYRLALLQREFRRLDAAVEAYQAATGRTPSRFEELLAAGHLDRLPGPDPFGGRFELRDGVVHATGRDQRIKTGKEIPAFLRRPDPAAPPPPHTPPAPPGVTAP
jgi:tetratricopeptide (TPR) repeat protein